MNNIVTVEVHENPDIGCDAKKFFNDHFNQDLFKNRNYRLRIIEVKNAKKDMLVVIAPNGDRRTIYAHALQELNIILFNLFGINPL